MKWAERALLRVPKHGTYHEYNKYKCRCEACVTAGVNHAKKYRELNRQDHRDAVKRCANKKLALIRDMKKKPCADCGVEYPHFVMQFDHLHSKEFQLSDRKTRYKSDEKILAEIAKCDVVCANCHSIRTYERKSA